MSGKLAHCQKICFSLASVARHLRRVCVCVACLRVFFSFFFAAHVVAIFSLFRENFSHKPRARISHVLGLNCRRRTIEGATTWRSKMIYADELLENVITLKTGQKFIKLSNASQHNTIFFSTFYLT